MTTLKEFNKFGEDLERFMLLRTSPIAIKMLQKESDIPEGAISPKKDHGYHLAQCQVFALSRRRGATIAMLKEDNWCWGPLMAYGLVDPLIGEKYKEIKNDVKLLPRLEYGKYIGIVTAPLKTANFLPDMMLIYSNTAQLRIMLNSLIYKDMNPITSPFHPIASCAYSVVPTLSGKFAITLPDPGEHGRAHSGDDEIIFSVPKDKIEVLVTQLNEFDKAKRGYKDFWEWELKPDFTRPEFYRKLYRECGLDIGE